MEQYIYKLSLLKEYIELKIDWPSDRFFMTFEAYCSNRIDDPNYLKWARMFLASLANIQPLKSKYNPPSRVHELLNQQRALQELDYQSLRNARHNRNWLLGGVANMYPSMRLNPFGFTTNIYPWLFNY